MTARRLKFRGAWLRRASQLVFLTAFFASIVFMRPMGGFWRSEWLQAFFDVDPLVGLLTLIAAHAVPAALFFGLVTLVVTALLGRVFCGWFCPLGTIHGVASRVFDLWRRRHKREHWSRWQLAKYALLVALVVMAIFGVQWLALLDPIALLYRTTTTGLLPTLQWAVEDGTGAIFEHDPSVGGWRVADAVDPVYQHFYKHWFVKDTQAFVGVGWVLGFFFATVALNFISRRFWCRYVCPLGALLGVVSWRPWLRRRVDGAACNQCDLCGMTCHGAATSKPGAGWKPQECLGCLNCTSACPRDGLTFELSPPWRRSDDAESVDLSRRHVLGGALLGVGGLMLTRITPQARAATFNPKLIRPPGARDERAFLERCIACGACMKICPTGALNPATTEAGLEGLFTPVLVPRIGECDYECNRCGQACPTEAILPLSLEEKRQTRIGLASVDPSRCIPYAYGRNCAVCEEHCPVPDKAIYLLPDVVVNGDGDAETIMQPHVDAEKCIGCGACERACPFDDKPAIRVTSANESRHADIGNQPILGGRGGHGYP